MLFYVSIVLFYNVRNVHLSEVIFYGRFVNVKAACSNAIPATVVVCTCLYYIIQKLPNIYIYIIYY